MTKAKNLVEGGGFEPPKAEPSDLQSDPFDHSGTPPKTKRVFCYNSGAVSTSWRNYSWATPNLMEYPLFFNESGQLTKFSLQFAVVSLQFAVGKTLIESLSTTNFLFCFYFTANCQLNTDNFVFLPTDYCQLCFYLPFTSIPRLFNLR